MTHVMMSLMGQRVNLLPYFSLVRRYDLKHIWELIIFTVLCFRS